MKIFRKSLSILFLFFITTAVFADTGQDVRQAYDQWTQAIETAKGNPQPVLALYASKSVLLATLAQQPLITREEMSKYFISFTDKKDMKVSTKKIITQIFPGIAINSGIYVFSFIDKNNKPVSIEARFSFVYRETDNRWLIVNHHSSLMPPAAH